MAKKKKITPAQHFKKMSKIYEEKGQGGVQDYANKHRIGGEYCKACETETPSINHICCVCGQPTVKEIGNSIITAWDFVEEHYPNYHTSQEIADSDDLHKLVNGEDEDGDSARKLLDKKYGGDYANSHILIDHNEALVRIYELAIENFLKKQKLNDVTLSKFLS